MIEIQENGGNMNNKLLIIYCMLVFAILFVITADAATDIRYGRTGTGLFIVVPAKVAVNEWFTIKVDRGSNHLKAVKFLTQSGYWCQYFPSDYIAKDIGVVVEGFPVNKNYVGQWDYYRWAIEGLPSSGLINLDVSLENEGRILFVVEYQRPDGVGGSQVFTIDAFCNYGPENLPLIFTRGKDKPNSETIQWDSCGGTGVISIKGDSVNSAHIYLNGQPILTQSCFNNCPEFKDKGIKMDIELIEGLNTLDVEISGKPGSQLQIDFEK